MYELFGTDFCCGVEIMTADRVCFANHAIADLVAVVNAEGAHIDDSSESAKTAGLQNIDRTQNIIGGAGIRIFCYPGPNQAGGSNQRVDVEALQGAEQCW